MRLYVTLEPLNLVDHKIGCQPFHSRKSNPPLWFRGIYFQFKIGVGVIIRIVVLLIK